MSHEDTPTADVGPTSVQTPADALIIVPVRDAVLFPGVIAPITIILALCALKLVIER